MFPTPPPPPGADHPSRKRSSMFPQDRVVMVGSDTTVCCVVGEGRGFGAIRFNNTTMNVVPLSSRSYAATRTDQAPSPSTGTNVFCNSNLKVLLTGTVVFVGCKFRALHGGENIKRDVKYVYSCSGSPFRLSKMTLFSWYVLRCE